MLKAVDILKNLQKVSGETSDAYTYQSGKIKRSSLLNGLKYYGMAIDKFLGNSLITRIMASNAKSIEELREYFVPKSAYGDGDWVDLSGMIAPKKAVSDLLDDVEKGIITDVDALNDRFASLHKAYYDYEWRWASHIIESYYKINLNTVSAETLCALVARWKESVTGLDNLVYADAGKEFSLSAMTSFGADGDEAQRASDFEQVRGSVFEADPFVKSVKEHIRVKSALADTVLEVISSL